MIRAARVASAVLGLAVLGWQAVNARHGRFVHVFLVPDLALGAGLIVAARWPAERPAAVAMLAVASAMGGVFLSATSGRLLVEHHYDVGTALTTAGLVPCAVLVIGLGRWLAGRGGG